jgi:nucleotide-binding universal stress UspA family protein
MPKGLEPEPGGYEIGMADVLLCCVDDSAEARAAARVAGTLARGLQLDIVLLHVASRAVAPGVGAAPLGRERLAESDRQAAAAILCAVAGDAGLPDATELRVELGDPAAKAREVADEAGAALVVIGSRGRGGVRGAVLGSVSRELAGNAPCPVVVVPSSAASEASSA